MYINQEPHIHHIKKGCNIQRLWLQMDARYHNLVDIRTLNLMFILVDLVVSLAGLTIEFMLLLDILSCFPCHNFDTLCIAIYITGV
jgi:hypothetical protein